MIIMKIISTYFNYRKKNYKDYLYNKYEYGIELAKNPEYDAICKIFSDDNSGTGVLIQSELGIKAILTAAHVVNHDSSYYVTFSKDNIKRKVIDVIFLNKENNEEDLAILKLDSYPDNIIPITLNNIKIKNEVFLHSAGYGCFLESVESDNIVHLNCDIMHVVSGMYKMKDDIELKDKYKNTIFLGDRSKFDNFINYPNDEWLISEHSEQESLIHPISQKEYPCSPMLRGFSGAPLFNANNELIGINDKLLTYKNGTYSALLYNYKLLYWKYSDFNILLNVFSNISLFINFISLIGLLYNKISPKFSILSQSLIVGIFGILNILNYNTRKFETLEKGYTYSCAISINKWYDKINSSLMTE